MIAKAQEGETPPQYAEEAAVFGERVENEGMTWPVNEPPA